MPYEPQPPFPSMPGVKAPLESVCEALREPNTEQAETVCSLNLWKRVNARRKVCGLLPLGKTKRSAKDLAIGLLEMREMWVKGEDWATIQPGDDPLLVRYTNKLDYPMPRTVLARISYEGVANWIELRVPKLAYDRLEIRPSVRDGSDQAHWWPKFKPTTKTATLTTRTGSTQAVLTMTSGSHGLTVDQVVDVGWRVPQGTFIERQGSRIGVKVTKVEGSLVTFDSGRGDKLPGVNTKCYVMTDPDDTITVHLWRRDLNPTCAGVARVCDRMKYTATGRGLDRRLDPKNWITFNSDKALGVGLHTGNTVNQWDTPVAYLKRLETGGYLNHHPAHPSYREPALKWKRYQNLNTGVGVAAILRDHPASPNQGRFTDYLIGTALVRATRISGLSWPGIVYLTPNPEELDPESGVVGIGRDFTYSVPVQNTTLRESINAVQTSIPVASANNLPFTGGYKMKIDNEEIFVTNTDHPDDDPHSLTVQRGYNNTTPTTHSNGAVVQFNDVTDFPEMLGYYEHWGNPILSNLPYSRSFLKDYIERGITDFQNSGGTGSEYTSTQESFFDVPTQTFETSGTWTCPTGVTQAVVLAWGAGGGGGQIGGGGGGAFVRSLVTVVPGTGYNVTVGTGGTASEAGIGQVGADSSFNSVGVLLAKGGSGGCSEETESIGVGGTIAGSVGDSKYAGGDGSPQGAGGSGAGQDCTGQSAYNKERGVAPPGGGDGGEESEGETPGGGGAARKNGANGKVIVMTVLPTVSMGGAFRGYFAVPDWLPYQFQSDPVYNPTKYNTDFEESSDGYSGNLLTLASFFVPVDLDGATYRTYVLNYLGEPPSVLNNYGNSQQIGYQGGTGYGQFTSGGGGGIGAVYFTPWWSQEIQAIEAELDDGRERLLTVGYEVYVVTDETVVIDQVYRAAHAAEIVDNEDIRDAIVSGIGPNNGVWTANLSMGWNNTLAYFDIVSASAVVFADITFDFKQRNASVSLSGRGITDVEFTDPNFALYDAKIFVWRRRNSVKTIHKYGAELFEHSVKEYNEWDSMLWPGGIQLNGASNVVEEVVVTLQDIQETAETEVETLPVETSIVEWSNDRIAGGVPDLASIGEGVPQNYVTNISTLQIGHIFGVDIAFNDFYIPFIKYSFNDDHLGHEDSDGLEPGVKQNAQTG